jgi:hypothetical protein
MKNDKCVGKTGKIMFSKMCVCVCVCVCVLRVHGMFEKFAYNKYHGSFQLTN